MPVNIPETYQKRVVILGAGFAGLKLARMLNNTAYQVVLVDKNNYHQFQPLFYQVAVAGLEPSSICFPLRKLFQKSKNVFLRCANVESIDSENKCVHTDLGILNYDHLIIATGANTNFFGNKTIEELAIPMKSVAEALFLRNSILQDYETALTIRDPQIRREYLDIVIVGAGPTGVEIAGALSDMRKYILPKDYKELNAQEIRIYLVDSAPTVLNSMTAQSSKDAEKYLKSMDVHLISNALVTGYDGTIVTMNTGHTIHTKKLIWAAGIRGNVPVGIPIELIKPGNRILVDQFNKVEGLNEVYAIGDIAAMYSDATPKGHPQVAQVAIQQAETLGDNLINLLKHRPLKPFKYNDKGSMATIGRNKAVVDLPKIHFKGFFAWLVWLFVHLFSILGSKNKLFIFINWLSNYVTYDQSLRLIIKPFIKLKKNELSATTKG